MKIKGIVTKSPCGRIRLIRDTTGNGHRLPTPDLPVGARVVVTFTDAKRFTVEVARG